MSRQEYADRCDEVLYRLGVHEWACVLTIVHKRKVATDRWSDACHILLVILVDPLTCHPCARGNTARVWKTSRSIIEDIP